MRRAARKRIDGEAVARLRIATGLYQYELAEKVGRSRSWLSHIESGRWGASPPAIAALAEALGVSVDDITKAAA